MADDEKAAARQERILWSCQRHSVSKREQCSIWKDIKWARTIRSLTMRVCVCLYDAVACTVDFQSKHCDPCRVQLHTPFFSFSISGWLPTAKGVCLSMSVLWGKSISKLKKIKNGIVAGQTQPLGAVWCKTRLLNSGGQFDRLCNLISGAILAQVICACAYDYSTMMDLQRSKGMWTKYRAFLEIR